MSGKISVYDRIYIVIKSIILVLITSLIFFFTGILSVGILNQIISNFIAYDYEYNRNIFKGLNIKTVIMYLVISIFMLVIIFVYKVNGQIYSGTFSYILKGINLFVLLEIVMMLFYLPIYIRNDYKIKNALIDSLFLVNYKIPISLFIVIVCAVCLIALILLLDWGVIGVLTSLLFISQLISIKAIIYFQNKDNKEGKEDE